MTVRGFVGTHRRVLFVGSLLLADAALILGSLYAADYLRFHSWLAERPLWHVPHAELPRAWALAAAAFVSVLWTVGLYEIRRGWEPLELFFATGVSSAFAGATSLAAFYLFKEFTYSRLMLWIFGLLAWLSLFGLRLGVKRALCWCFEKDIGVLRLVTVGDSPAARTLVAKIRRNPQSGLRVVGQLVATRGTEGVDGRIAGRLEEAFREMQQAKPHICLFAEPVHGRDEMASLLARCQEAGIRVWLGTDLMERYSPRMDLKEIESVPVIVLGSLRLATWERVLKRGMDVSGSMALLALCWPFMLYAATRIRREIGAPILFRQTRIGFQGRPFTILKLRAVPSMEGAYGHHSFCEFLRAYSLDELPQLWNVLRGEMSLVGPRPETPDRVRRYSPWNRRRLQVKPGITGVAQISGVRGEHDFDTKSRFDVMYLENQSLLLDLRVLLRTPLHVWNRRRHRSGKGFEPPAWRGARLAVEPFEAREPARAVPGARVSG